IYICHRARPPTRWPCSPNLPRLNASSPPLIAIHSSTGPLGLVIGLPDHNPPGLVPTHPAQHRRLVIPRSAYQRPHRQALKLAFALIQENFQLTSTPASHQQILPPISIHITPAHSRPQLAQLVRQQRLALEVVEFLLVMGVLKQLTLVFVQGLRVEG